MSYKNHKDEEKRERQSLIKGFIYRNLTIGQIQNKLEMEHSIRVSVRTIAYDIAEVGNQISWKIKMIDSVPEETFRNMMRVEGMPVERLERIIKARAEGDGSWLDTGLKGM